MIRILYLTIVKEYYRQNAIFIFAVMMFAFGFLRATEHLALMNQALGSLSVLLAFCLVWVLHGAKVISFAVRALTLRQNEFLYHLLAFPAYPRFRAFLVMIFALIQLTFLYALPMMALAFEYREWLSLGVIVGVNGLLVLTGALILEWKIRRFNSSQNVARKYFGFRFRTPRVLFYPRYLLVRQTVLFLITKGFTALVLMGVCFLFPTDEYDARLISLGCLLAGFGQSVILQHLHFFERIYFDTYRNMPLSVLEWFGGYVLTLGVIILPEAVVLARNFPMALGVGEGLVQFFFLWSVTVFLFHYQAFIAGDKEAGFQVLFFSGLGLAILIMFKIPAWVFSGVGLILSYLILKKRFYAVE